MDKRTIGIGIGIVAIVLILAISMTASAKPDPQSPSTATFTDEDRYDPSAKNDSAVGGNITNLEISGDILTSKWQGYYGNVSGTITLQDSDSNSMIDWDWTAAEGGIVLATTNSSPNWSSAFDIASGTNVNTAWSFTTDDTDSATNTFIDTNESVKISGTEVTSTACAYTYNSTGIGIWQTAVVSGLGDTNADKDDYLFAGIISADGNSYNDREIDFQMIVPTPEDGTGDTYEFYIELK